MNSNFSKNKKYKQSNEKGSSNFIKFIDKLQIDLIENIQWITNFYLDNHLLSECEEFLKYEKVAKLIFDTRFKYQILINEKSTIDINKKIDILAEELKNTCFNLNVFYKFDQLIEEYAIHIKKKKHYNKLNKIRLLDFNMLKLYLQTIVTHFTFNPYNKNILVIIIELLSQIFDKKNFDNNTNQNNPKDFNELVELVDYVRKIVSKSLLIIVENNIIKEIIKLLKLESPNQQKHKISQSSNNNDFLNKKEYSRINLENLILTINKLYHITFNKILIEDESLIGKIIQDKEISINLVKYFKTIFYK